MRTKLLLLCLLLSLACGVVAEVPTHGKAPDVKPTVVMVETYSDFMVMYVCVDRLNARALYPDGSLGVINVLGRGQSVRVYSHLQIGLESWVRTDAGYIDPQYLCEEK